MVSRDNAHGQKLLNIRSEVLICLFLVTATLVVYLQVRNHSFVVYDDGMYVTDNRHVKKGLSIENFIWAFSNSDAANWHPLTWLSHMLDIELYGMNPGQHHLTNVLFHIFNTLLLFFVLKRMTGKLWQSGFVAALFALHPLHVESVAWISERKDVLSTFFWLLSMWGYARYVEHQVVNRYLLVLFFFIMGLMAKSMLVTLPFVLLLLDYWPLRRFQFGHSGDDITNSQKRSPVFLLVREKIPFFVLSIVVSIVTLFAQQSGSAIGSLEKFPFTVRIANAFVSYVIYIIKMIWPTHLAAFYPYHGKLPWWQVAGACVLLVFISYQSIRLAKQKPWFAVGWLWYVGTLIPVIGLVQVGFQAMADRYTYVPLIGLFLIVAWGISELMEGFRHKSLILITIIPLLFSIMMIVTWVQVGYWNNSTTLFKHALNVTKNNYMAHNAFGNALTMEGKVDEAVFHYSEALRIKPFYAKAHYNKGHALATLGRQEEAIDHFKRALQIKYDYAEAHDYLGYVLTRQGKEEEAIDHFRKAIQIKPDYAEAHNYLGHVLAKQGKYKEAIDHFHKALEIEPNYTQALINLKNTLANYEKNRK